MVGYTAQAYWQDEGMATATGLTYTTNVRLSAYPTWSETTDKNHAVDAYEAFFDEATYHDYLAVVAIAAGDNTARPSVAIKDPDPVVRARWLDLGAANAWAALDEQGNSYLQGYSSAGAIVDPDFTVAFTASQEINRLFVVGAVNVASAQFTVSVGGTPRDPVTASFALSGSSVFGRYKRTASIAITSIAAGSAVEIRAVFSRPSGSTIAPQVALFGAGYACTLADTEWGVDVSTISFSKKQRDETFGTMSFVRRGSAKRISATCCVTPASVAGDTIQQILVDADGIPVFWDFNSTDTDYDRLRVYGFYTKASTPISAPTWETMALEVEGLVE
jgi:hypothetical protein